MIDKRETTNWTAYLRNKPSTLIPNQGCKGSHKTHMIRMEASMEIRHFHHCLFFSKIIHDASKAIRVRRKTETYRINMGTFADQFKS